MELSIEEKHLLHQFFSLRPVKRAYVFGSYARHEAVNDSDLDILVELDHSKPIGMKFFIYKSELEDLLKKKVDLVSSEGLSRHVKPFIDKDKILIYEGSDDR
jgi:predicted nucleotidyltransferase